VSIHVQTLTKTSLLQPNFPLTVLLVSYINKI